LGPRASHKSLATIIFRRLLGSSPHNVLRGEDNFKRKLRRFLNTDDSGDESAVNGQGESAPLSPQGGATFALGFELTRPARTDLDLNQDAQAAANVSITISRFGIG
jgi:hypothetical protein